MADPQLISAAASDLRPLSDGHTQGAVDGDELVKLRHFRRFVAELLEGEEIDVADPAILLQLMVEVDRYARDNIIRDNPLGGRPEETTTNIVQAVGLMVRIDSHEDPKKKTRQERAGKKVGYGPDEMLERRKLPAYRKKYVAYVEKVLSNPQSRDAILARLRKPAEFKRSVSVDVPLTEQIAYPHPSAPGRSIVVPKVSSDSPEADNLNLDDVVSLSQTDQLQPNEAQASKPTPRRRWNRRTCVRVFAGTSVTAVAAAVGTYVMLPNSTPPKPETLVLDTLAVDDPSKVDADIYDGHVFQKHDQIDATAVDILLHNHGQDAVVVTDAQVDILYDEQLENCDHQGDSLRAKSQYAIIVPTPTPSLPYRANRKLVFQVNPLSADRFTMTIGPADESISSLVPSLIVAHISLIHDNSTKPLDVGNVALVARAGAGARNVDENAPDKPCIARNAQRLDKLYGYQAVRSDEVEYMHNRYTQIAPR